MINEPYVLFTRIPLIKNARGQYYCEPLWAKDLKLHLGYIENLGICCPVELHEDVNGLINISHWEIKSFYELKKDYGLRSIIFNFIPNFVSVTKACTRSKIAHSGGAGWAFPLSFYLLILRPFIAFKWVIVIESSFWMLEQGEKRTFRRLVEHFSHKILLTLCVKAADARIFTQSYYRKYFLGNITERTLINPATWIDQDIISTPQAVKNRKRPDNVLKIIFPSRLEENKGVYIVLNAIKKIKAPKGRIHITIIGSGILEHECRNFLNNYNGNVDIALKEPVPYGTQFFELIANYDFVLVPIIKQEQPRIIFDAFSQGIPVIGSDTSGVLDITNNENAITFRRGDSSSLAEVISSIYDNRECAVSMGLAGLRYLSGKTHFEMHQDRQNFLNETLYTTSTNRI